MIIEKSAEKQCCLCGVTIDGWGNDPWPLVVDDNAWCCDACNAIRVIPARLMKMQEHDKLSN